MASRNMQSHPNVYKPGIPLGLSALTWFFSFFSNEKSRASFVLELCTLHKPCNLTLTHRPGNKISPACRTQRPKNNTPVKESLLPCSVLQFILAALFWEPCVWLAKAYNFHCGEGILIWVNVCASALRMKACDFFFNPKQMHIFATCNHDKA